MVSILSGGLNKSIKYNRVLIDGVALECVLWGIHDQLLISLSRVVCVLFIHECPLGLIVHIHKK